MSTQDDGGPAFPIPVDDDRDCVSRIASGYGGMSLRDAMAIAAAGHIWTQYQVDGTAREYPEWRQGVAIEAYRLADEMLAAREGS